jgi:hypothetical protein
MTKIQKIRRSKEKEVLSIYVIYFIFLENEQMFKWYFVFLENVLGLQFNFGLKLSIN